MLSRFFSARPRLPGLLPKEPLLFERSVPGLCGVDLPDLPEFKSDLGPLERRNLNLPSLSEVQVTRHYVRMSRLNYSLDQGIYPLGSCTMKFNPRLNEAVCRLPGLSDVHPLQPVKTVQGCLEAMDLLSELLLKITGMNAVTLTPAAGAHGESAGVMAISEALIERGDKGKRNVIIVPEAAHGTNPATSAMSGFKVRVIRSGPDGLVDMDELRKAIDPTVAGMMLTNPNTCGLFESNIRQMTDLLHENSSFFYMDGANLNALFGRVSIADLGVDAMHINLHKSFSAPHGGGGPGSGPVLFSSKLAKHTPYPYVIKKDGCFDIVEKDEGHSLGRMKSFHGQFGILMRALAYILSLGGDGLKQSAADSVMNANYIKAKLQDCVEVAFPNKKCMHEVLFSDGKFTKNGYTTMDVAKAMADAGYHPPTVYFPGVVNGAMLFEPTESESKEDLDRCIEAIRGIVEDAAKNPKEIHGTPYATPVGRPDETRAARSPILKYPGK